MKEKKLTDEELNKLIAGLDYQSWAQNLPELSQAAYMLKYQKAEIERLTEERDGYLDDRFAVCHALREMKKENAELQKQVDELKQEKLDAVCDLNMRIVELDNELKQAKTLLEFREETIKYLEDANIRYAEALENKVKDTAKEIFGEQKKFICSKWKQYMTENELIEFAEERYGVEVE